MKIAMVGQKGIPATYGGIERHVEELSTRLVERGHEVTVYSRPYYTKLRGEFRGVKLVTVPTMQTKHFDTASHCAFAIPHMLAGKFDVVHFHALGPSIFAGLPKLSGARTAVTVHGLDWQREKWGRLARWILKKCEYTSIHFPTRTIVVSRSLKDYFHRRYSRRVSYIPNGINIPSVREGNRIREMGIEPDRYVLFVGRLVPEKGCHYLLDAFRKVNSDLDLVIAGGSSFSTEYTENLRAKAGKRTRFLGYVYGDVLDELYSNARLFVLPSDLEGLPIALLEAMSFGNACLVSDIPENVEVAGDNGTTFAKGDVDDLARQISALLANPENCRSMGESARKHVLGTYDWDGVTLLTESLYYSMLRDE
ncbi:MAG: glycosyltransferase family 4 protein [Candidatus Eisenbacteria sp.]|nr:glycosyltransferase family 4 protein [Candidatus Eisenbacteria bacterium]